MAKKGGGTEPDELEMLKAAVLAKELEVFTVKDKMVRLEGRSQSIEASMEKLSTTSRERIDTLTDIINFLTRYNRKLSRFYQALAIITFHWMGPGQDLGIMDIRSEGYLEKIRHADIFLNGVLIFHLDVLAETMKLVAVVTACTSLPYEGGGLIKSPGYHTRLVWLELIQQIWLPAQLLEDLTLHSHRCCVEFI